MCGTSSSISPSSSLLLPRLLPVLVLRALSEGGPKPPPPPPARLLLLLPKAAPDKPGTLVGQPDGEGRREEAAEEAAVRPSSVCEKLTGTVRVGVRPWAMPGGKRRGGAEPEGVLAALRAPLPEGVAAEGW